MLQEIKNWKRNIKDRNGVNMANKKKENRYVADEESAEFL